MPTTVTKTIAATSSPTVPDYTSLASWLAACPANLVTSDQIWDGTCLDQGKFTTALQITGITVDATRYIKLRSATGASFSDKAAVRTTALFYNSTTGSGVAIEASGGAGAPLRIDVAYTQVFGLQIKGTGYAKTVVANATGIVIDTCIITTGASNDLLVSDALGGGAVWKNCLMMANGNSACLIHSTVEFCTIIQLGAAGTTTAFDVDAYTKPLVKDCAVFGFNTFSTGTPIAGSNYNATNNASAVTGANNLVNLTFASQFVSTTNDFRSLSSGALAAGTPISGITTDISIYTRNVTTPYIGAWEATAPTSSFTASPTTIPKGHSGNITLTLSGTGEAWVNATTVFTPSGVAGVVKISQNVTTNNAATLVVTTGSTAGTLTITESVTGADTTTITVATATLAVSPTTAVISTSPTLTFTGANTLWTTETAAGLFTVSGVAGVSIGTPTVTTNTAATAVLTIGATTGTVTITDTSTGATTTFTVSATSGTIAITSPVQWKTYQRNGSNQADIAITGTYTGGPATKTVEASFNGGAYATIATAAAGVYSGTLSAQAAGRGTLSVRFVNETAIIATVANLGIGDVFVVAGQSNAVGQLSALQTYTGAPKASAFGYVGGVGTWIDGIDPFISTNVAGSIWPIVATHVMGYTGFPVAFIQTAVGGKSLDNGNPSPFYLSKREPSTGVAGTGYNSATTQITNSGVNGARAILWVQCENDIDGNVPLAPYVSSQIRYAINMYADVALSPVFIPCIRGYSSGGGSFAAIRPAIAQAAYLSPETIGPVSDINMARFAGTGTGGSNEVHWISQTDADTMGARFAAAIISHLAGDDTTGRGPRLVSIQHNSARTVLTVTFDQVLKTGLTFDTTIWAVTGNAVAATISSIAYNSTDTRAIDITLSAAATLPILVSLGLVTATAGKVFPTGSNYTLPNATVINLPADPFVSKQSGLASGSVSPPPPPPGAVSGARIFEGF